MKEKLKSGLLIFAFVMMILISLIFSYDFILFALNGFDLNYLEIDKCMDHGHSWNYEKEMCNE